MSRVRGSYNVAKKDARHTSEPGSYTSLLCMSVCVCVCVCMCVVSQTNICVLCVRLTVSRQPSFNRLVYSMSDEYKLYVCVLCVRTQYQH
jgi:hypothetical protein